MRDAYQEADAVQANVEMLRDARQLQEQKQRHGNQIVTPTVARCRAPSASDTVNTPWCQACGCGSDYYGFAHLPTCTQSSPLSGASASTHGAQTK